MKRFFLSLLAVAMPALAHAQSINPPPSIANFPAVNAGAYRASGLASTLVVHGGTTNTAAGNTGYLAQVANGAPLNVFNTAFGYLALNSLTSTQESTAIGYWALKSLTTGYQETAVGTGALQNDVSGTFNTAVGSATGRWIVTSQGNSAFGHGAMAGDDASPVNCCGGDNTAIGAWSGQELGMGGVFNTFVGDFAGLEVQGGRSNVAVGVYANAGCNCLNNIAQVNNANFNVAIGVYALQFNTTNNNVAVGYQAAQSNVTGLQITALGHQALQANTGGQDTAIGYLSQTANVSALNNVSVGASTLINLVSGTGRNVAVGSGAGRYLTTASDSIAVGALAMYGDSVSPVANTAAANVVIGTYSGAELTTGGTNVFVGWLAGEEIQTGASNVAFGALALAGCNACNPPTIGGVATSANDAAFGYRALMNNVSGVNNTALGYEALMTNTAQNQLVAVGARALLLSTGASNIALGFEAGSSITSGNGNIIIGTAVASATLATGAGNILIGVSSNCDTPAAGTNGLFLLCAGAGTDAVISAGLASTGGTMRLNGAGAGDTYIGSATPLAAGAFAGYFHFPNQSAAPSVIPAAHDVACAWNTATQVLNCYDGSGWFHSTFTAGAG